MNGDGLRVMMLAAATVASVLMLARMQQGRQRREPLLMVAGYFWCWQAWTTILVAAWVTLLFGEGT